MRNSSGAAAAAAAAAAGWVGDRPPAAVDDQMC